MSPMMRAPVRGLAELRAGQEDFVMRFEVIEGGQARFFMQARLKGHCGAARHIKVLLAAHQQGGIKGVEVFRHTLGSRP